MTSSSHLNHGIEHDRFTVNGVAADASTVASVRREFTRWLRRNVALTESKLCDIVLAVNEALANVAEFAYPEGGDGTVDVQACHDPRRHDLSITISDRGRWREADPPHRQRRRGRGIPLMRTLADSVLIDTSGLGTTVCLRFDDVGAPVPVSV